MNRTKLFNVLSSTLSMRCRVAFPMFLVLAFHASFLNGQEDPAFEGFFKGMVMLDKSIPDFVAISKLENIVSNKEKAFGYLSVAKKMTLEIRRKQVLNASAIAAKRVENAEKEVRKLRDALMQNEREAQTKSSVYAISRGSAEQLLLAAQLELQKVTWELASEQELLESDAISEEQTRTEINKIEMESAKLDLESLKAEYQVIKKDLEHAQSLEKQKAIGTIEMEKTKLSFTKAQNAVSKGEMRLVEQEIKNRASENAPIAGVRSQIRKLTARKNQIEIYIKELFDSMNNLTRREGITAQIDREEKELAANEKLRDEWSTKGEEIEVLLATLATAEITDKPK